LQLPIPISYNGKEYAEAELKVPTPGVIADTGKVIDASNHYSGMLTLCAGCLVVLIDRDGKRIEDKITIREILSNVAYRTLDYTVIDFEIHVSQVLV